MQEQTLVLIKPDAVQYTQQIFAYFRQAGFRMAGFCKHTSVTAKTVERHYGRTFAERPEYRESVIAYLMSGQVTAYIFERENAIVEARKLVGSLESASKGTIRGDFPSDKLHSLVHASDSTEAAQREIALWFGNNVRTRITQERSVAHV